MRDVAELAHTSLQTVSNYVNGRHEEMSVDTRERVATALSSLGYTTNRAAASLRSQRTRTLAVLVVDEHARFLADPLTDQIAAGLADVARDRGYGLLIHGARPDASPEEMLAPLREGRADGAVLQLSGARRSRRALVEHARSIGVPIVVLDETALPSGVLGVRAEQQRGARALTEHLIDSGHRRLAFLGAAVPWAVVEQRVAGFRQALRAHRLDPQEHPVVLEAGYDAAGGERLAGRVLDIDADRRPTALVCASDLLAAGALRAAHRRKLHVPGDVAVTGFNDFEFSEFLDPPLTTVRVPAYDMGSCAARLLMAVIEGQDVEVPDPFAVELLVRASS
jgi:DNA-binding LacI/PurR family transcriptional regulator